jgi:hypothetical protein
MTFEFRLDASSVASYLWGSSLSRYPLAAVDRHTLVEVLAHESGGHQGWTTPALFRERTSFIHEMVHYLQDISTGIGHWDHLARRTEWPKIFAGARTIRQLSLKSGGGLAWAVAAAADRDPLQLADRLVDGLRYVPSFSLPTARTARLAEKLAQHVRHDGDPDVLAAFMPESLLEAEAMAVVAWTVASARLTDDEQEVVSDERDLWHPSHLGERYTRTWDFFLPLFLEEMGPDAEERWAEDPRIWLGMALRLLTFLIDLACAHPSPRLLGDEDLHEHEPGLKFARLCAALRALPGDRTLAVYEALAEQDYRTAEANLASMLAYPYPASHDVYADWADVLAPHAYPEADTLSAVRCRTAEARVADPRFGVHKRVSTFIHQDIPIHVLSRDGLETLGQQTWVYDEGVRQQVFFDLVAQIRDQRLVDFFVAGRPYVCPLAREMRACQVATGRCATGLSAAREYPAEGCMVRTTVPNDLGLDPLPPRPVPGRTQ